MTYCITLHRGSGMSKRDEMSLVLRAFRSPIDGTGTTSTTSLLLDEAKCEKYYPHILLSKHLLSWRPRYGFKEAFKTQRLCLQNRIRQSHNTSIHKLHETHLFFALINYSKKCLICLRFLLLNIFVKSCSVIFRGTAEVKASHVEE